MEHSYFKDRLSAYHDNELKPEEHRLIAEHLAECAECRQLLEALEKFDTMVESHSGLSESDYWESAARKIERAITEEPRPKIIRVKPSSWRGLRWKVIGVAASFAILAFIALYQRDISDEVGPPEPKRGPAIMAPSRPAEAEPPPATERQQPADEADLSGYVADTTVAVDVEAEEPLAVHTVPGKPDREADEL
ncbi:MAG: zf-HC2 domain-containing protein, partial [Candidatus Zixiibacteriota bacterium]